MTPAVGPGSRRRKDPSRHKMRVILDSGQERLVPHITRLFGEFDSGLPAPQHELWELIAISLMGSADRHFHYLPPKEREEICRTQVAAFKWGCALGASPAEAETAFNEANPEIGEADLPEWLLPLVGE